MSDYTEVKGKAEVLIQSIGTLSRARRERQFHEACTPQIVQALIAENERLLAAISTPESVFINMKAGRIARISLRSAIDLHGEVINGDDAQQIEIAKLRAEVAGLKTGYEAYERVNAELKAENEALRKDAERLQVSTAFVQKLCDSAGKQPSVATGYLHDILAALGQGEQS